jgi:hypothetical protein
MWSLATGHKISVGLHQRSVHIKRSNVSEIVYPSIIQEKLVIKNKKYTHCIHQKPIRYL